MKVQLKAQGTNYKFNPEGNEAGVRALTTPQRHGFYAEQALELELTLTANEARQIYFALLASYNAYRQSLEAEFEAGKEEQGFENVTFLTGEIAKVTQMLFELCDDHDENTKKVMNAFLNV